MNQLTTEIKGNPFRKKETLVQLLSFEFCEIFKNTFFTEHLQTTASVYNRLF